MSTIRVLTPSTATLFFVVLSGVSAVPQHISDLGHSSNAVFDSTPSVTIDSSLDRSVTATSIASKTSIFSVAASSTSTLGIPESIVPVKTASSLGIPKTTVSVSSFPVPSGGTTIIDSSPLAVTTTTSTPPSGPTISDSSPLAVTKTTSTPHSGPTIVDSSPLASTTTIRTASSSIGAAIPSSSPSSSESGVITVTITPNLAATSSTTSPVSTDPSGTTLTITTPASSTVRAPQSPNAARGGQVNLGYGSALAALVGIIGGGMIL